MNENKYHLITVKNPDGEEIILSLPWDANLDDWMEKFKVILLWLTFDEQTIDETLEQEEK